MKVDVWLGLVYGEPGLHFDGHSRGSMTIGNAMSMLEKLDGSNGILSNTTVSFFGPAYNAAKADEQLARLQGYYGAFDPKRPDEVKLELNNHFADPVGRLIGGNPPTGGTIPNSSNALLEALRAISGQIDTTHNCYGSYPEGCTMIWGGEKK